MFNFLITLGGISLGMSAVILLMLALQKPIKKRFAAMGRYIIWSVIIIRLCLPVSLDILPKFITVESDMPEASVILPADEIYEPATPQTENYANNAAPSEPSEIVNDPVTNNTINETYTPSKPTVESIPEKTAFKLTLEHLTLILVTVWAIGAITFLSVTLIRYTINVKTLNSALTIPCEEILSAYKTVCRELNIKKAPPLYIGRPNLSPMTYGFIRPKVIVPEVEVSAESMTYILRHELTHYKRGDLYFKLLAMFANALHWFNPFAYIACGMMSAEAELSCDETALRSTDMVQRLSYGDSMLEIVKLCKHSPKLTTGFSPKKKAVKERFENILNTTQKKKGYWIVALIVVGALLCTSIIGFTYKNKSKAVMGVDSITVEQQKETPQTEETDHNLSEQQRLKEGKFHVKIDQWHTESEEWKLYYDFDAETLVLEHIDGRRFAYGDEAQGVHALSPAYKHAETLGAYAWLTSDHVVISYSVPKKENEKLDPNYLAVIDTTDGSVKAVMTKTVDEILELHGLNRDFLIPFNDWYETGTLDYSYSFYPMWGEDSPTIFLYSSLYFGSTTHSLSCVTEFDKNSKKLGGTTATKLYYDDPDPVEEWERKYALKPEDIMKIEKVRDTEGVNIFKAFLEKDTAYLEEKAGYPKGTLEDYKTLHFGNYMFAADKFASGEVNPLLLYVEITESGIEGIEVGNHRFVYSSKDGKEYLSHYCAHYTGMSDFEPATTWLSMSNEPMLPDKDSYTEGDFWAMMMMLRYSYSANKIEEFEERAGTVFGVSLDLGSYTLETLYDGMEKMEYKDNKNYYYSESEYGDGYVVIQFYADYGFTVPAYKIRYNFHDIEITDDKRTFTEQAFDTPCVKYDVTDKEAIYVIG